jgi:hypothetical protein
MKHQQPKKGTPVTGPVLKDLVKRQTAESKQVLSGVTIGSAPLAPPDLYQDAGGGYNRDFTFPQE